MTDVTFFYPHHSVGGIQYLFIRMAKYLLTYTNWSVALIDYKDGFMHRALMDKAHHLIPYQPNYPVAIETDTILVLPLSDFTHLGTIIYPKQDTRVFFWDVHPYNLIEHLGLSGIYKRMSPHIAQVFSSLVENKQRKKLASFVDIAISTNGLAFMAKKNFTYNKSILGFHANPVYLPLPIDIEPNHNNAFQYRPPFKEIQTLHIGWLGRLSPHKIKSIERLISDVYSYTKRYGVHSIHLHFIGDGIERRRIQDKCSGIAFSMPGQLLGEELDNYARNLHIGVAMGTSALELANRGVPTILLSSGLPMDNLKARRAYRWLFLSNGFDVTVEETSRDPALQNFEDIVRQVQTANDEYEIGQRCKVYVQQYHALPQVGQQFVNILQHCTLTYTRIQECEILVHSPYERLLGWSKSTYKRFRKVR